MLRPLREKFDLSASHAAKYIDRSEQKHPFVVHWPFHHNRAGYALTAQHYDYFDRLAPLGLFFLTDMPSH